MKLFGSTLPARPPHEVADDTAPTYLTGAFDFAAALGELVEPLARRAADEPHPLAFRAEIEDLVAAIATAVRAIARLLAEADAARRTRDIPIENRGRAKAALVRLAPRPPEPEITSDDVATGRWAAITVDLAEPFSEPLSGLLSRAIPPHQYRGGVGGSVSERVTEALREPRAEAHALRARLDGVDRDRAGEPKTLLSAAEREAQRLARERADAEAELRSLGIEPNQTT